MKELRYTFIVFRPQFGFTTDFQFKVVLLYYSPKQTQTTSLFTKSEIENSNLGYIIFDFLICAILFRWWVAFWRIGSRKIIRIKANRRFDTSKRRLRRWTWLTSKRRLTFNLIFHYIQEEKNKEFIYSGSLQTM